VNGPTHYAEAEKLVAAARDDVRTAEGSVAFTQAEARAHVAIAAAQVHASLAQVAATVEPRIWDESDLANAWAEVLS